MIIEVRMGEKTVGRLAEDLQTGQIYFQYEKEWIQSGLNISPFHLEFHTIAQSHLNKKFHGLHGVFADSLPDYWGMTVLAERLRRAGLEPERVSPLVKLSYLGQRAMGALEYHPQGGSKEELEVISLAQADHDASLLMEGKKIEGKTSEILSFLVEGSSAGGAKPKVHAYVKGDEIMIGGTPKSGFESWIIKLSDIPQGHKDSRQSGATEYAFMKMASIAGIEVPAIQLFQCESGKKERVLFGIKRFDRHEGKKIHMHSLSGLLQISHQELSIAYEDFILRGVELTENHETAKEIFRRCVFNRIVGNCDDHAKNFAFLLKGKEWILSPSFDITSSPGMNNRNTHAMTVNGSRTPTLKDLLTLSRKAEISEAGQIIEASMEAVEHWDKISLEAGLKAGNRARIKENITKNCQALRR